MDNAELAAQFAAPPPVVTLTDLARALVLGCVTIYLADGELADKEWADVVESLRVLGADEPLIQQALTETQTWLTDGGSFGQRAAEVITQFGQQAPHTETVKIYRFYIWAIHADRKAELPEFEALWHLGNTLGLALPVQLFLVTEWLVNRLREAQQAQQSA